MQTRRTFIKTTTLAGISTMVAPYLLKGAAMKKDIGLQLYTVRDHLSKDLPGTLKQVAKIGYTWLEAAGYNEGKFYGLPPKDFKTMVEDLGMTLVSSHVGFSPEQSRQVVDAHLELGVPYVVLPWMSMPENPGRADYAQQADMFNQLGDACKSSGLKFGYHNHDFEFVKIEETTGFDLLLEMTDPELVCFECDIYWMTYARVDPMEYFMKYPGRFELWHVKDMEDSPERGFTEVGEGTIPYGQYFETAEEITGMRYFFVEQDTCKKDPLESVAISFNNLKNIL
jgi:sugar phosphate isomerase/epimerase